MANPNEVNGQPDMSTVPAHVRAGAGNATAMMEALARGESPYPAPQQAQDGRQGTQSTQTPGQGERPPAANQGQQDANPQPTNPTRRTEMPADRSATEQRTDPPRQDQGVDWEHRYNSLKGQFDRQQELLTTERENANALRGILATIEASGGARPQAEQQRTASDMTFEAITPEEETEYGPDFIKMVEKVAGKHIGQLQGRIRELEGQVGGVQRGVAQTARERLFSTMDDKVPNWRQINDDPEFVDWLAYTQRGTRQPRQNLLVAAYQQNDAEVMASFFEDFLTEKGRSGELGKAPQTQAQQPPRSSDGSRSGDGLEKFAAPAKSKGAASVQQVADQTQDEPTFSRAQISQFYADVAAGRYRGREKEQAKMEQGIFTAQSKNRIT